LFYIRKDYNLIWSVVTDIGNKCKQAGRRQQAKFAIQEQQLALAVCTTSYIEGDYSTLLNSMIILMVYVSYL
jgi:hypothetical protein